MEQEIVKYLQETFSPIAIILHGSRVSGHESIKNDWDFVLLHDASTTLLNNGRAEVLGENIEFKHHQLPVIDVMKEFGTILQNTRVVFEVESKGTDVLVRAQAACAEPLGWTKAEKYNHSLWMRGRVDGMKDTLERPLVFEKYAADFYQRITNYWYWAVRDKYPKPIYLALEEIKEVDLAYFSLIKKFVDESGTKKIEIAEQIYERCFGDTK
ncbi:MAG: hypothetical protein ACI9SY_000378 [Candidatus Paceibacteria bacterium]|jgi:hypothetical protein